MARDKNGRFLPGDDPDRHEFTREQRQKGYQAARGHLNPKVSAWVYRMIRSKYRKNGTWYPKNGGPNDGQA